MPMYNLLEYSDSYSMTSGSLWNYYRNEINDDENENDVNENMANKNKIATSKSFKYNTKILGSTPNNGNRLNAEVNVPLKYVINSWRSLDFSLINWEIELDLQWSKSCVITEILRTYEAVPNTNPIRSQATWVNHKKLEQHFK